jgi:aldose 1-epimerase
MNPKVRCRDWGRTEDGQAVELYTLTNRRGLVAKVSTFGATLTELWVPDRAGVLADVVLGFDDLAGYRAGHPYFGSTVGRVANRIAKGRFALDGKTYELAKNDGPNSLHGGLKGFDKVVWRAEIAAAHEGACVRFHYLSRDGEEGYPGTLSVRVDYTLTDDDELRLDYFAETDRPTPVNLTNHSYFNLAGSGDVLGHELTLAADFFLPVASDLIPTGEIRAVDGTPMDFRSSRRLEDALPAGTPGGYDYTFVLRPACREGMLAARVREPRSGRILELHTTEPGVQLYSGNYLDGSNVGKGRRVYGKHHGFCLETQHFPDSVNRPEFPSVILRPGDRFQSTTRLRFASEP